MSLEDELPVAEATLSRRVDVTTEGQQALYPVLRATNGPGWEDPGAVHDRASTPPVASAGGIRLLAGNGGGVPGVSRYVDGQRSSQALPRGQLPLRLGLAIGPETGRTIGRPGPDYDPGGRDEPPGS